MWDKNLASGKYDPESTRFSNRTECSIDITETIKGASRINVGRVPMTLLLCSPR